MIANLIDDFDVVNVYHSVFNNRKEFKKAKTEKDYTTIVDFLTAAFSSLRNLSEIFKVNFSVIKYYRRE